MAGNTLMSLLVKLGIDTSEFEAGMTEAQKQAQTAGKNLSKLGGSIAKTGAIATAAITLPLAMAANSMISSASDLNETMSKVQVVFGSTASEVLAFGDTAAKSLGMSKNEALAAAGTYGNLFRAMNMTEAVSSKMSVNLVTLAGDLASFNNMDPTEVMDKLRAGLSGESEPLKSLGVNINEAIIKTKALEMGLYSGTGAMDAATKAQATYALILEQTSLAQGDFARTSDGLANSQRIMKAELGDVSAKLGTQLLPIALKVVTALSGLIDKFSNMSPAGQKVVLIVGAILAVIGPLLTVIGTVISVVGTLSAFLAGPTAIALGATLSAILPIVAAIAAVIAIVVLLYKAWKGNWGGIRDIAKNSVSSIGALFNNLSNSIGNWFKDIPKTVSKSMSTIGAFFQGIGKDLGSGLKSAGKTAGIVFSDVAKTIYTTFIKPNVDAFNWLKNFLGPLFDSIGNVISAALDLIGTIIAGFWQKVIIPAAKNVMTSISNAMKPIIDTISNSVSLAFTTVGNTATSVWGQVSAFFQNTVVPIFQTVGAAISSAFTSVANALTIAWNSVTSALRTAWTFLVTTFTPAFQSVGNFFSNTFLPILQKIGNFFSVILPGAFSTAYNWIAGKLVMAFDWLAQKVKNLTDFFNGLAEKLRNLKDNLPDWLTPGSPTPLEIGIMGISKAVSILSNTGLPDLSSAISLSPVSASFSAANSLGNQSGAVSSNKNVSVVINNPVGQTTNDSVNQGLQRLAFLGVA